MCVESNWTKLKLLIENVRRRGIKANSVKREYLCTFLAALLDEHACIVFGARKGDAVTYVTGGIPYCLSVTMNHWKFCVLWVHLYLIVQGEKQPVLTVTGRIFDIRKKNISQKVFWSSDICVLYLFLFWLFFFNDFHNKSFKSLGYGVS